MQCACMAVLMICGLSSAECVFNPFSDQSFHVIFLSAFSVLVIIGWSTLKRYSKYQVIKSPLEICCGFVYPVTLWLAMIQAWKCHRFPLFESIKKTIRGGSSLDRHIVQCQEIFGSSLVVSDEKREAKKWSILFRYAHQFRPIPTPRPASVRL